MRSLIIVLIFFGKSLAAQNNTLHYDITKNDKIIGFLKLQKKEDGDKTYLNLVSDVNVNFIINTSIKIKEHSVYENNNLIYSESKRFVNDNEKVNNKTFLTKGIYYLDKNGSIETLKVPLINYNLLLMYFNEPNNIARVYSDSFQQMLKIDKVSQEHFNIQLPDGGNNEYFYKDGKCTKVVVNHTFFQIEMRLKNI